MAPSSHSLGRTQLRSKPATPALPPSEPYLMLTHGLLDASRDHPLVIGVYALIARLYAIHRVPVVLSARDLAAYDPTLSYGAAVRALARLTDGGWLIDTPASGQKSAYTPAWGRVAGQVRPWDFAAARKLGCPDHLTTISLRVTLLDAYLGQLIPQTRGRATIRRYFSAPLLTLADIGVYALGLARRIDPQTTALLRLGLVDSCGVMPPPDMRTAVARASQLALGDPAAPTLTSSGLHLLGSAPMRSSEPARTQALFFAPRDQIASRIGQVIGEGIGNPIGHPAQPEGPSRPPVSASSPTTNTDPSPPCRESKESRIMETSSSTSGSESSSDSDDRSTLLAQIGVHPKVCQELQTLPRTWILAALADARERDYVKRPAGWVVDLLRRRRDHAWVPAPPDAVVDQGRAIRDSLDRLDAAFAAQLAADERDVEVLAGESCVLPDASDAGEVEGGLAAPAPPASLWDAFLGRMAWRVPAAARTSLARVACVVTDAQANLVCPDRATWELVQGQRVAITAALRELGVTLERVTIGAAPARTGPCAPVEDRRPAFLAPEIWASLPPAVQGLLIGARWEDGQVWAATSFQQRTLEQRHADLLARLRADRGESPA